MVGCRAGHVVVCRAVCVGTATARVAAIGAVSLADRRAARALVL